MSTEQTTLADSLRARAASKRRTLVEGGARYGRVDADAAAQRPADAGSCRSCGAPVECPPDIARGIVDEHGRVPACPHCTAVETWTRAATQRDTSSDVLWEAIRHD